MPGLGMFKNRTIYFLFSFFLMVSVVSPSFSASQPNVILITIDTLRADHLGCYGYKENTSPNLDRFASEGMLFKRCYAQASETAASLTSLLTGHYPHETTVTKNEIPLPLQLTTMAEYLKKEGYTTGAIVANYVLRKRNRFDQGFDFYDDSFPDTVPTRKTAEKNALSVTAAATQWLDKNASKKFFLWLHYMDPHGPYTPPAPYKDQFFWDKAEPDLAFCPNEKGKGGIPTYQRLGDNKKRSFYVAQYDGEIAYLDNALGSLLKTIEQKGLLENSIVVITADHGEEMGEHGYYFAHGETLYTSSLHIPLIIRYGSKKDVVEIPVQSVAILPTILKEMGIKNLTELPGQDLFGAEKPGPIFSEIRHYQSLIDGDRAVLFDSKTGQTSLYDLGKDRLELRNIPTTTSSVKKRKKSLLEQLRKISLQNKLDLTPPDVKPDPGALENLKSLGYTQ